MYSSSYLLYEYGVCMTYVSMVYSVALVSFSAGRHDRCRLWGAQRSEHLGEASKALQNDSIDADEDRLGH